MTVHQETKVVRVNVMRLPHGDGLPLPAYHSPFAAGMDLMAAIDERDPVTIQPGHRELVPTGLSLELPEGFEGQVRPRSGVAAKHGVTVLNSPGTIDADYRGEVMVILINLGAQSFKISRGDRIAQLVIQPVTCAQLNEVAELGSTLRGTSGFGSTGTG